MRAINEIERTEISRLIRSRTVSNIRLGRAMQVAGHDAVISLFHGVCLAHARILLDPTIARETGLEVDDLLNVGLAEIIPCLRRWNPRYGASFRTFALNRAKGAMRDEIRRWSRHSRRIVSANQRIRQAEQVFQREEGRLPTTGELARKLRKSLNWVLDYKQQIRAHERTRLGGMGNSDRDGDGRPGFDWQSSVLVNVPPDIELRTFELLLGVLLAIVDRYKRALIFLYLCIGLTQQEVGEAALRTRRSNSERRGLSASRVSQLLSELITGAVGAVMGLRRQDMPITPAGATMVRQLCSDWWVQLPLNKQDEIKRRAGIAYARAIRGPLRYQLLTSRGQRDANNRLRRRFDASHRLRSKTSLVQPMVPRAVI